MLTKRNAASGNEIASPDVVKDDCSVFSTSNGSLGFLPNIKKNGEYLVVADLFVFNVKRVPSM